MKLSPEFATIVFWIAAACAAVAQLAIFRSTWSSGDEMQREGDTAGGASVAAGEGVMRARKGVELFWAIVPAVALIFVFAATWRSIVRVSEADGTPIQQYPPATVSGAPAHLALTNTPAASLPRRVHGAPTMVPTLDRKLLDEQGANHAAVGGSGPGIPAIQLTHDVGDAPEVPQS